MSGTPDHGEEPFVTLKDGRVLNGIVGARTERTLTFLAQGAEPAVLEHRDIQSVETVEQSLMPEGLLENLPADELATELVNRSMDINRVVGLVKARVPLSMMRTSVQALSRIRIERLRGADAVVRQLSEQSEFESKVWQFPVVLIPVGSAGAPDSIVLRPIHSVDGMTAQAVRMPDKLLARMSMLLLSIDGICAVFYDLTHKPPGTIEWE